MRRIRTVVAGGICSVLLLSAANGRAAPWQDYRARGIFAWVKTSSQKSCLDTPYGIIKNNCTSLAEVDVPLPYDFGNGWHSVIASVYRWGTPQPSCQALGIATDGTPSVIGPIVPATGTGWSSLPLGKLQAPSAGSFVACWLNPGDDLDSVNWTLSGTDP